MMARVFLNSNPFPWMFIGLLVHVVHMAYGVNSMVMMELAILICLPESLGDCSRLMEWAIVQKNICYAIIQWLPTLGPQMFLDYNSQKSWLAQEDF